MNVHVDEIGPDLYRISTYLPQADLQFNHFLVRDDEPLLYHTGLRTFFPAVRKGVAEILDPATIRWISFSHFEADECGSLNEWLALAPGATPVCGAIAAGINIDDVAARKARPLADGEVLSTGRRRFRHLDTPHLPHGWDAGLLFEETEGTLFCSDLFLHHGQVEPLTGEDVVGRARASLQTLEAGPFAHSVPWTPGTDALLKRLADLSPRRLALMHGSSFQGNGAGALRALAGVLRDAFGKETKVSSGPR